MAGDQANKGCPPDRDGDGVPDAKDNCPDEPGDKANQGCKKKQLAKISDKGIEIIGKVFFKTNSDQLQPRSFPLLDNVASVLNKHPEIKSIQVEGHTDIRGPLEYNLGLSLRRAESVVRYLVKHGVKAARLTAVGFGPKRPIKTNDTKEGRAANRRVEFNFPDNKAIKKDNTGPDASTIDS